jgi:hypothetical protein
MISPLPSFHHLQSTGPEHGQIPFERLKTYIPGTRMFSTSVPLGGHENCFSLLRTQEQHYPLSEKLLCCM